MVREALGGGGCSAYCLSDEKQEPDEDLVGGCSRQREETGAKTLSLRVCLEEGVSGAASLRRRGRQGPGWPCCRVWISF